VEIKDPNATEKVVALMEHYVDHKGWNYSQFQISSFLWDALFTVFRLNTSIPVGVLTENDIDSALLYAKKINAHSINPCYKLLDVSNTKLIQENGFKLYTWTVNVPEDVIFVKMLQVDGIITDFPDSI
jgi:glycerophosphoryl diester phosphodiesterase